jgi:hypothetical protein
MSDEKMYDVRGVDESIRAENNDFMMASRVGSLNLKFNEVDGSNMDIILHDIT